jgi:uncharacterized protein DUF507
MKTWDGGKIQDKLINRIERQERQKAFNRDRFLKFKLPEIHNELSQVLLMKKVVETDNPAAITASILRGLRKAMNSSEFDLKYFIAPLRELVPRANPYSLYMTQYIMEVLIDDPDVIEIYGTDQEIYKIINEVFSRINIKFDKAEEDVIAQIGRNKSLVPGTRDYEIALDQMMRQKLGQPQQ